jgi:hypothetical protein
MKHPKVFTITAYPAELRDGLIFTLIAQRLEVRTHHVRTLEELFALRKDLGDTQAALGNPNVVGIRQIDGIAFRGQKLALRNSPNYFTNTLKTAVSPVNGQTLSPAANRALANCAW